MNTKSKFLVIATIVLLIWSSCKRNPNQERWDTNILAPLVKSTLTLKNLINDTLLKTNADSTISLVYQSSLYNFTLDSLFKIPDTTMTNSYGLNYLNIGNQNIVYKISLGQLLDSAGYGALAGIHLPIAIPNIPTITPTSYPLSVDSIFRTMTLINGQMVITIQNQFPITIDSVTFVLKDSGTNAIIATHTFDSIPPNTTKSDTESLAGKTVTGAMIATLSNVKSPGSNGNQILIDTSKLLITTISVINLLPSSATAVFPAQDL